jgi:hypothetical protein
MQKRLNELMTIYDKDPDQRLDDGELLSEAIVAKAAAFIPPTPDFEWSAPPEEGPQIIALRAALARDGFTVVNGAIRSTLPIELGIAAAEDETTRMLKSGPFPVSRGHLEQALDAHDRGDLAAANSQTRAFYESLLDEIAIAIDPSLAGSGKGEARRARLAAENFLRADLNEWSNDGKNFVNGLLKRLHPHGSHPGLSDEADCTFRLRVVLLTAQYFLDRYEAWTAEGAHDRPD